MVYNVHHSATSPPKCFCVRSLKNKGFEKWISNIWLTFFVFLLFLFVRETLYDDSDDAAFGVYFSSGLLGLAALMSMCPSPYASLITIV